MRQKGHKAYLFDFNNTLYYTSPTKHRRMWDDKDYYTFWEQRESVCSLIEENRGIVDFYIDKILASEAKIIGFTVHFSSVWASLEIARRIKKHDNRRIIVFGGPDSSLQQKGNYLINQECVDIVVYGEGEGPLFEIIDRADNFREIDRIKGCLILRDGRIAAGEYMPGVKDLDSLPMPDYSDFKEDINSRTYRQPQRLDIFDSRGCPTRCHFCSEWQFWGKFRSKSGQRIYQEIVYHLNNFPQVNYFYFIGSLVNGNMAALERFCDLVIDNNLGIRWAGQAVIRQEMTKEFLKKAHHAGCTWLSYGIESGSQRVVSTMNKKFSVEIASRVLRDTKAAGIAVQANFMFGIPTETKEDFQQTLGFLKENRESMDTILASQSFCVIDKDTYLYNHAKRFGIRNREHHLYWESNEGENNYRERQRRYEEFCQLALSLGVPETSGVLRSKPDKWQLLGDYFFYKRDYPRAIENYLNAQQNEKETKGLLDKLSRCYEENGDYDKARQALNRSLQLNETFAADGAPDEKINPVRKCSDGGLDPAIAKTVDSTLWQATGYFSNGIKQKLSGLNDLSAGLKMFSDSNSNGQNCPDFNLIGSDKLAKILRYFARINYKGIDLEKVTSDFSFNEKQQSMARALYSHGLWKKLSNYILVDVQKARKEPFLFGYPYWLIIDPCNWCNLSCPFCPTGQRRGVRTKGELSFGDFKTIIDKLGPYLIHIDLVNWGEPFLNKDIIKMIRCAKQHHMDIKIDSNLNHLDEKKAEELVLSGLDKIVVSIDGLSQETYSKYRVGGNFQLAMDNLRLIIKKRKELKSIKPYITWQFLVFRHNEGEVEQVEKMGKKLGVDHVGVTKAFIGDKEWIPLNPQYSNYNADEIIRDETSNHFKTPEETFCHWPWEAIAVNPNASVSVCCTVEEEKDDFGNFFDQPFENLWNSEKYLRAREYVKDKKTNGQDDKNICVGCRHLGLINVDILSCHSFFVSKVSAK